MSVNATANTPEPALPDFKTTLGHPRPLWMLFMTEFWERFAFYGIRWALVLYIVAQFYNGSAAGEGDASRIYGAYLALVRAAAIFGGYVADRVLGYQRSILTGAIIMVAGLFMISLPQEHIFKLGLATIIVGNGLFKPNISTMVGKLYGLKDERRDSGFTIFYGHQHRRDDRPGADRVPGPQGVRYRCDAVLQGRVHRLGRRHADLAGVVLHRSCRPEGHRRTAGRR